MVPESSMKFEKHTFSFPDGTRHTIDNAAFSGRLEGSDIAQQVSTFVDQILEPGITELSNSVETREGPLNIKAGDIDKARKLRNQLLDIVFLQAEEADESKKEALRKKIHPLMDKIVVLYRSILYEHCLREIERIQRIKDGLFVRAEKVELDDGEITNLIGSVDRIIALAGAIKEDASQNTIISDCNTLRESCIALDTYNKTFFKRKAAYDV